MSFFKKNRVGIIGALIVGVICVLPQFILPLALGNDYKGIQPLLLDDEDIYRARIHEILDGYPAVASPYFYEYKTAAVVVQPVSEWLYSMPAFIFGLSAAITASKFILPALLFIFVYLLILRITRTKEGDMGEAELAALTGAFLVTLGYDFVDAHHVLNILLGKADFTRLIWTRIVNPISGAVEIFAFLLLLHSAVVGRSRFAGIGAGFLLAAMVGYFFSFGISICILGASLCAAVIFRRWKELKALLIILGVSTIVDIPYWYSALHAVGGGDGRALSLRNGMKFTHELVLNKFLLATIMLTAICFCYTYFVKKDRSHGAVWVMLATLLTGSLLAFNQQVITGREIWFHHFVQYVIPISFVTITLSLFYSLRIFSSRLWRFLMRTMIIVTVSWGVAVSVSSILSANDLRRQQSFAPVFSWLEQNTEKPCVVLVKTENEELDRNIPAYTHCDVYDSTYVFVGVTHERVIHNFLLYMRLHQVTADTAVDYLYAHETQLRGATFDDWAHLLQSGRDPWLRSEVATIVEEYKTFMTKDLKSEIQKYRMDYLVSEHVLPVEILGELPGLKLATTVGAYYIYSF